jgi:hypothetical protein
MLSTKMGDKIFTAGVCGESVLTQEQDAKKWGRAKKKS